MLSEEWQIITNDIHYDPDEIKQKITEYVIENKIADLIIFYNSLELETKKKISSLLEEIVKLNLSNIQLLKWYIKKYEYKNRMETFSLLLTESITFEKKDAFRFLWQSMQKSEQTQITPLILSHDNITFVETIIEI